MNNVMRFAHFLKLTTKFFNGNFLSIRKAALLPASNNWSQNRIIKIFDITDLFQNCGKINDLL
jgi:hypothetical protein